jgi:hypothetical protein
VSLGFFSDVCWVTAVKLYEFEDSDLFRWEGIPVLDYGVAGSHWEVCWKAEVIWLARGCQGSSEDIAEYPLEVVALVRERLAAHCTA